MESTLHPQLLHLGTKHYRINPSRHSLSAALSVPVGELEELAGAGDVQCPKDSLEDTLDVTIEAEDNGFIGRLHVPAMFHRFIVGPRSTSLDQIQRDFSCKVILPHVDSGSEVIIVKASVRSDVHSACRRIRWIQTDARSKTKPTHFISLPANYPELQKNFNLFRKTVLDSAQADKGPDFVGVNSDIFPRPAALHFTLVPLLLANESEVLQACDLLKQFFEATEHRDKISGCPLRLTIQGLEYMNDDPNKTSVLYAKVAPSPDRERLQNLTNALDRLFEEHNLTGSKIQRPDGNVLLHMTVMNARLASRSTSNGDSQFSVVGVMRECGNFVFAKDLLFDQIHLSVMGSQDGDGFYTHCSRVILKQSPSAPEFHVTIT
ncbi:hypothetical protein EG68_05776 [Paragonimus skrjabini miyazakii]|uniref:Activating signal cointegrator 1 complex subunit 1 n=1 Tax=Paragonimus skrjabini miyazakii TaxID=59628 RepID=A0A8S9YRA3_9TREM|nr:hypothetical protein EG68_05776 [Paragonimus skrjabini miyazakii]